jgi:hypothetical protein
MSSGTVHPYFSLLFSFPVATILVFVVAEDANRRLEFVLPRRQ